MKIKLHFSESDLIKPHILDFSRNINAFSRLNKRGGNNIDLSQLKWVFPLDILPIASLLFKFKNKNYKFNVQKPLDSEVASYLRTIKFFEGVHSYSSLKNKSYIPIVSLLNSSNTVRDREKVLSCLIDLLLGKINSKRSLANVLGYALSEIFDNIWEHSATRYGWFLAQYYKNKKYADICFLDNGVSIKGAYNKQKIRVTKDSEAIQLALKGRSTKKEGRGFGLRTTRKLVTKSPLEGKFLIISGQAGYFSDKKNETFFTLNCTWGGTIVLLRINKTRKKIDYTKYVE